MKNEDFRLSYGQLIAECWKDETVKQKFINDPIGTLKEKGIDVEEGVSYIVLEAPRMVQYIVLPHCDLAEAIHTLSKVIMERSEQESVKFIPEGAEIRIVQDAEKIRFLIIPFCPKMLSQTEIIVLRGASWHDVATNVEAVSQVVAVANTAAYANIAVATNVGTAAAVLVVAGIVLI